VEREINLSQGELYGEEKQEGIGIQSFPSRTTTYQPKAQS
jgi:hypothetical protein